MSFPVYQAKEWQCRYVFQNRRCCGLSLDHEGDHVMARRNYSLGAGLTYLECPCCGDDGAASDGEGSFYDGQALICGCPGWVSVDADGSDDPWINNGDAPCQRCEQLQSAAAVDPQVDSTGKPSTRDRSPVFSKI